jgi:hypothetical protein
VAECTGAFDACGNACVDRETNPLFCGECDRQCEVDEVCTGGECRNYRVALANECLPGTCGGRTCCFYPNVSDPTAPPICVEGGTCPP